MRAPAPGNDGMGSLMAGDACRFRVWAPNAQRVQLILNDIGAQPIGDLAAEPGTGNWSADEVDAPAGTKYQYVITNKGGPNNDNSQPWYRTDARAFQVESSAATSMGYRSRPRGVHQCTATVHDAGVRGFSDLPAAHRIVRGAQRWHRCKCIHRDIRGHHR